MDVTKATEITGGLSHTTKMPGFSFGIPAIHCIQGSQLREDPESPCYKCYAMKGMYRFPNVKAAQERRLAGITHPEWVEAMVVLIKRHVKPSVPFFRWHDSGDIQSMDHLLRIVEIAKRLPWVVFWLPTQEREFVEQLEEVPTNLTIRVSNRKVGEQIEASSYPTSGVAAPSATWESIVALNTKRYWACPSSLQNNECGSCRACWNPVIEHVVYRKH